MDEAKEHCFKTPPIIANAKQGQAQNNNNIAMSSPSISSPTPLPTQNSAAPPKRIIKKIPLDFNKLKQAGLHVKLAEALSKQNASATKNIASARSAVTSATASVAALPSATASATYANRQQQSERQTVPIRNITPPTVAEQSSQIKSLLKTRILNKSTTSQVHPQQQKAPATTTASRTEASGIRKSPTGGVFTVPIAKADLTARPKPPLLLNLVNQLPKHRAMWGSAPTQPKKQQDPPARTTAAATARSPGRTPARTQRATATAALPTPVQPPAPLPAQKPAPPTVRTPEPSSTSQPPLIVLENKVLAPDEKIDLRVLRLPNGQHTALSTPATSTMEMRNAEKLEGSAKKPTEILDELPPASATNATQKKIILNANKLKLPRAELAQLAKKVCKQAMQHVQQKQSSSTDIPATIALPSPNLISNNITTPMPPAEIQKSLISPVANTSIKPKVSSPIKPILPSNNNIETLITSNVDASPKPEESPSSASTKTTSSHNNQSVTAAVTSDSQAVKTDPISHELSAVDFIAQLTSTDDDDIASYMELSAEELSMNAKFGCPQTLNPPSAISTKPEDDLPIGKILQMEDMNILHATLNVNGNKPNVLCISPNAIKLQNSALPDGNECPPIDDNDEKHKSLAEFKPLNVTAPKHVYTNTKKNSSLSKPPTLVVTAPSKEKSPEKQIETPVLVPDKEADQPAKSASYRPKKAKINLVQRNKRQSTSKPNEITAKKLTEVPEQVSVKEIPTELNRTEAAKETVLDKDNTLKQADNNKQTVKELGKELANIESAKESDQTESKDLATTQEDGQEVENVVEATTDETVILNKPEHVITEDTADVTQAISDPGQLNLSKERDLTQLYHPPKLPKNNNKILNNDKQNEKANEEQVPETAPTTSVSLLNVLTQKQPPPQGEPQLPFRSSDQEANKLKSMDRKFADALGIQNLLTHLAAENVVPPSQEEKPEETAKMPRKKLVKTRPVLNAKRSAKVPQAHGESKVAKQEDPQRSRKRPHSAEGKANGIQRVATSSTSDDNADSFHGFDDETPSSKRIKLYKGKETDISDDATPDYDETEEEPQPDIQLPAKKLKTETALPKKKESKTTTNHENIELIKQIPNVKEHNLNEKSTTENPPVMEQELESKQKRRRQSAGKGKEKSKSKIENSTEPSTNPSTETEETGEVVKSVESEMILKEVEPVVAKKKRGRPRKSIITSDAANAMETSADFATPKASTEAAVDTSTPTPKRRGRKPKAITLSTDTAKNGSSDVTEVTAESCKQQSEFYMRLLLIRKREQLESDEELREDGRGEGDQQCGLCLVRCDAADWQLHLGEHYGVGWLIDEPAPLLTRSALIKIMKMFLDACTKRLSCRLCNRQLTSALGMLIHLEGCGANQRIVCDYCKNSYTKLSYQTHYRNCPKREQPVSEEQLTAKTADKIDSSTPVYSNAGRAKRKSTLKAETKLEKIADQISDGKDFECDSSDYDLGAEKESSSDDDESEGVESNDETVSVKSKVKKEVKTLYGRMNIKDVIRDRWEYFTQVHYAKSVLYPHLLPRYEKLSTADAKHLLPSKDSTSMRYAYGKVEDDNWKQLEPLEGFSTEYEYISYLGNAVKELAWVPLPPTVETQYLLCSQRTKMLGFARQFKDKPMDEVLLLLELKVLPSSDDGVWPLQTRLHYGICVPHGPVHSFAFMPSGGYDESINRLGLLAVGSSFGAVIYALPLRVTYDKSEDSNKNQQDNVIVLQPMLTLSLDVDKPVQDPCTKICWSEGSGHNLLVGGYASGNIAFYDIADEQGLNCIERNNQRHFLPASFFYLGERNIYYLELHYDSNGPRWLAVGTMVRKLCIYDIANWSLPLPIVCDPVNNLFLGGVYWPPLWESLAVGGTEVYKSQFPRLITVNPTAITFTHAPMDHVLCSPRAVHFNWDQMTLVTVTDNGDVAFIKCTQFNYETLLQKRTTTCRIVSLTEARYLGGETAPNCISPVEFKENYGLIVKPLVKVTSAEKSTYINIKRRPNFDLMNLLRLNCVRWNWNVHARNWLAIGAEHGLLRILKYGLEKDFRCI